MIEDIILEKIALTYFKCFNKKDLLGISELIAESSIYYDWTTVYSGKSMILDLFNQKFNEDQDQVWHIDDIAMNERRKVFAKLSVMFTDKSDINVVKVFGFNEENKINLIQAYKQ